jgi:hypothetical protein
MDVYTTETAVQFCTGNFLDGLNQQGDCAANSRCRQSASYRCKYTIWRRDHRYNVDMASSPKVS